LGEHRITVCISCENKGKLGEEMVSTG
jgi:hypothetical protein